MTIPYRPIALSALALVFSGIFLQRAQAGDGHFFAPVSAPVVREEGGSCHLAFAPSMLPANSWKRMMGDLSNHFGTDASVAPTTAERITRYLVENAGDSGGQHFGRKLLRGVSTQNPPLRITELPKWVSKHRKISAKEWAHPNVKTKANCAACHTDAEHGYYDE
jgi:hypothetical protein